MLDDIHKIVGILTGVCAVLGTVWAGIRYWTPRVRKSGVQSTPALPNGLPRNAIDDFRDQLVLLVRVVRVGQQNSRVSAEGVAASTFLVSNRLLRTIPDLNHVSVTQNRGDYIYSGPIPEEFDFIWNGPADGVASDSHILWNKVAGQVRNPWLESRYCEGYDLYVKVLSERGEPVFRFVPFANQGSVQGGMKICEAQSGDWESFARGANKASPRAFTCKYRFVSRVRQIEVGD